MQRGQRGSDSRRLRLVIDAKEAEEEEEEEDISRAASRSRRWRMVLESQERTMRTIEAEKHGRRSDSGGGERRREKKKGREKSWFRGSMDLRASMKRKNLEERLGVWTDREACVGTRGTGSKMEEGRRRKREVGRGRGLVQEKRKNGGAARKGKFM